MGDLSIKILGSGREIGRAGIVVRSNKGEILLDYGASIEPESPLFPLHYPPKRLSCIILSHAHLDHSGAIPLMYTSRALPIYLTDLTLEIADLLIRDFLKISGYYIPYEIMELITMRKCARIMDYGIDFYINCFKAKLLNAGHIPGSAMVLLSYENMHILYTSDFNMVETCLLDPADVGSINFDELDAIILECTYAEYSHPPRENVEREFIEQIIEVLDNDGIVLIPAFAVGRAQEIACVLYKYSIKYPIYIDGMARKIIYLLTKYNKYSKCNFGKMLRNENIKIVDGWKTRRRALKEPSVIITPAGMLKGGAVHFYAKKIIGDRKNAIFLVSYQGAMTPGRDLLTKGKLTLENSIFDVNARVYWFDFSSHCGRKELLQFLKLVNPDTKLILVHVDSAVGSKFKKEISRNLGLNVSFPKNGDVIKIK